MKDTYKEKRKIIRLQKGFYIEKQPGILRKKKKRRKKKKERHEQTKKGEKHGRKLVKF